MIFEVYMEWKAIANKGPKMLQTRNNMCWRPENPTSELFMFGSTSEGLEVNYLLVHFCLPFYLTPSLWVLLTNTRRNLTLFHFHTF